MTEGKEIMRIAFFEIANEEEIYLQNQLKGDDLAKVEYTIRLNRRAFRRMKLNIGFSMVWNVIGLTLSATGLNGAHLAR